MPGGLTARKRPSGEMAKSRKVSPWRMGTGVGWLTGMFGEDDGAGATANGGRSTQTKSPDFFSVARFSRMRFSSGDH